MQIKNKEDLIGKTILSIYIPKNTYEEPTILFTDGSFVAFTIEDHTEGFGYTKKYINIEKHNLNNTDKELLEVGIISKQEYEEALKLEDIEREKRQKEYDLKEKERIKLYELEQLEKLKTKYGSKYM